MKSRTFIWAITVAVVTALAISAKLVAQDAMEPAKKGTAPSLHAHQHGHVWRITERPQ